MKQFVSRIIKSSAVADGYRLLELEWSGDVTPSPGQFLTLWNRTSTDPLLRRPFAVSAFHTDAGSCDIIYQIRGKATQAMAACVEGDLVDVIGPLGHGFPKPQPGNVPYLLAGGIGFGPVYYLAGELARGGVPPVVVIGARSAPLIPEVPYSEVFHFCTDDGSKGYHGTVVDMLETFEDFDANSTEVYACGPRPMLAAAAEFCEAAGVTCWVAMEQTMGCGVGACMGCAIRAREPGKYLRVCTDGPVFNARDLLWS